jgi:hypothetical protein
MSRPQYPGGEYSPPPFHPDVALHLFRIWVDDYGVRRNAIAGNIGMTRAFVEYYPTDSRAEDIIQD